MQKEIKRIAVLTSGGDAPGMNACIRAVFRAATKQGVSVLGVRRGYLGLISHDLTEMKVQDVDHILRHGGTTLSTARCAEMMTPEGQERAANTCKHMGIDALVVIGGDGSFRGAKALSQHGISVACVPATIDNDIGKTEYTIGFDTASNTAMDAVDKLRDSMQSHERCSVVEIMGREAGHLALQVGVSVGATCILLPEREADIQRQVIEPIRRLRLGGRKHHLIVVAEGYGDANMVAKQVEESTGIEARVTILGHIQRGGSPTAYDRTMATQMGCHAVNLLLEGKTNRAVCFSQGQICDHDIDEVLENKLCINATLFDAAQLIIA